MKRTKIVCTIGPASEKQSTMQQMIAAGMDVARLNFSHNKHEHHAMLIKNLHAAAKKVNRSVAILQDLQGPRIRIGEIAPEGIPIKVGASVTLMPQRDYNAQKGKTKDTIVPIQVPGLHKDLKKTDIILIEDGTIQLEVTAIRGQHIVCEVLAGDIIKTHKGMNFPTATIHAPALTAKDKADVAFGIKQGVDFVALSFVKNAADIHNLRAMIAKLEKQNGRGKQRDFKKPRRDTVWPFTETKIIAKIERKEAVTNFDEILSAVDGIMVARGDLGLEIPIAELPLVQKRIVRRCIEEGKPVIVATQMLDSMIRNPVPTRAEILDVANAIFDGTDAIMLSGESASGKYPLKAVQTMAQIAAGAEQQAIAQHEAKEHTLKRCGTITEVVTYAAQDIAEDLKVACIVCATTSGFTARAISRFRPDVPIIACAVSPNAQRQLCLSWGVESYYIPFTASFDQLIDKIKKLLVQKKIVKKGDTVVIATDHPTGYVGMTNLVKVETF